MKEINDRLVLIIIGILFAILILVVVYKTVIDKSQLEIETNRLRALLTECQKEEDLLLLNITQEWGTFRYKGPNTVGVSIPITGGSSITITLKGNVFSYNISEKTIVSYGVNNQITSIGRAAIVYERNGRVSRIGNANIGYDMSGRVSRIGNAHIGYDASGRVSRVGNAYIAHDMNGNIIRIN